MVFVYVFRNLLQQSALLCVDKKEVCKIAGKVAKLQRKHAWLNTIACNYTNERCWHCNMLPICASREQRRRCKANLPWSLCNTANKLK